MDNACKQGEKSQFFFLYILQDKMEDLFFRKDKNGFSFFLYILLGARFRALSAGVQCTLGLQDESLQVNISKLP